MSVKNIYNEKLLVQQLSDGCNLAFRKLFDIYRDDVYAYSISMLKTKELAEEIVQDVFLKIWQHRDRLNPNLSFKSYIFTITRNLTFNLISKVVNNIKLKEKVFYKSQKFYSPIEDKLVEGEYEIIKYKAIEQLPPKRKVIFQMSRFEDKTYEEISNELNISVSTVKGQMSKSLTTIRDYLKTHADITFLFVLIFSIFFE